MWCNKGLPFEAHNAALNVPISIDGRGNSRSAEPLDLASPRPLGREQQKVSWTRLAE